MNAVVTGSLNELITQQLIYRHIPVQSCLVIHIFSPLGGMSEVILLTLGSHVHCSFALERAEVEQVMIAALSKKGIKRGIT